MNITVPTKLSLSEFELAFNTGTLPACLIKIVGKKYVELRKTNADILRNDYQVGGQSKLLDYIRKDNKK